MPTVIFSLLYFLLSWLNAPIPASSWPIGPALNQYASPDCVGFAFATWLQTAPGPVYTVNGGYLYSQAKLIDGNPGIGTDPAVMATVVRRLGYLESVQYSMVVTDALTWMTNGPVLVEVAWTANMDTPLHGVVTPGGERESYHEFMCYAFDPKTTLVACENSWGAGYGINGHFFISSDNLQGILYQRGFTLPVKSKHRRASWYRPLTPFPL